MAKTAKVSAKGEVSVYSRISKSNYDQISAIAKEQRRPIATVVAMVLEGWLRKRVART